jgi:serine/threonine-protein kinase
VADEPLLNAAARIADGEQIDWGSITDSLRSEEDRATADELALLAQIAAGHRQLHQILPADSETPPELVPDRARWGHLDLLNIVGRGSYGTVYRAWDTRLERLVALKLFHGAPNPEAVMQEGRMLARMRHEHVVTVHGADVLDGVAGIWMELVHGRTLENLVKGQGPLSVRDAAAVGVDVARALTAVHAAGLLHCDVKAQNVVRESTGRVVLMDFGAGRLAPEYRDADEMSDVAGTPRYMAPELFVAGATATKASDIYSFGVLLYFLVSGRFPVEGRTLGELKRAHEAGTFTPLNKACKGLPKAYVDVVTKALHRDPSERYESVAAMQEALSAVAARAAAPPIFSRRQAWLGSAVIVAVIAATLVGRSMLSPADPDVRSIAVLPMRNLTGDPAKAYVADGLTEVLISNLARIRSVRVPSFAAVGPLRNETPSPAVAEKLGVELLLAGSISEANNQIRLAVHLTDRSGNLVWGDEVTRELAGVMSAQNDLTRRLAQRLALDVGTDSPPLGSNARAQDAYLRGLALRVSSPSAQQDAARAFREAVDLDPGLADAWAHLSLIETLFAEGPDPPDRERSRVIAREMAERAIGLDPSGPNGHAALGSIQFYSDWDFAAAEQSLKRAVELSPSAAFARQRYAMLLSALGRHDEAIALAREAQRIEPSVAVRSTTLGAAYYYARDYSRAIQEMRRGLAVSPDFGVAHFGLGRIASAQGRHTEAIAEIERALAQSRNSGWLVELARAYAAAGRREDVERILNELRTRQRSGNDFSLDNLAYIAAAEGRIDDAFILLEDAFNRRVPAMLWIAVDPRVDPLRNDQRFDALVKRMRLRP